jgi:putative intracellular protease/amidase
VIFWLCLVHREQDCKNNERRPYIGAGAGARYVAPPSPFDAFSITSGRVVTGANPASVHITVAAAIEAFEKLDEI